MGASITERLFSAAGKTVLITGGAGGIGRMLTAAFLAAGANVYVTGRKLAALEEARAELIASADGGARLGLLVGDLSTAEGTRALAAEFLARESRLDVLINNAGRTWGAPFAEFPDRAWANVFAVNVQAPFVLAQALLPALEAAASEANPARIINIGSIYAQSTDVMHAYSYTASKAGLQQLTRVMARELAAKRILVNAIAPGLFPSNMTEFVLSDATRRDALLAEIPLGRAGTPEDIGGLALFLAGRAGAYVTGAIIPLDGGILVGGRF